MLIAWENEAYPGASSEFGKDKFEIVVPSLSILAEPPVAVVDKVVDKKGTRAVAEAYLKFIYTPEGQEIAARNYYRPRDPEIAKAIRERVRQGRAVHDRRLFGGWRRRRRTHFDDGGIFDQIYTRTDDSRERDAS